MDQNTQVRRNGRRPPAGAGDQEHREFLDRVPPHNLDAERSVLASVMLDARAFDDVVGIVSEESFYADANRRIWRAIASLHGGGRATDTLTVSQELQDVGDLAEVGGPAYLAQVLEAVPYSAHAEFYARIVRDKYLLRRLIDVACDTLRDAFTPKGATSSTDAAALLELTESRLSTVSESSLSSCNEKTISDALNEYNADLDREMNTNDPIAVHSYWQALDSILDGGFRRKQFVLLAARPSVGKSALAGAFARNICDHGGSVLFITLEQSRAELIERFQSLIGQVLHQNIRRRTFDTEDLSAIYNAQQQMHGWNLRIDDTAGRTLQSIASQARRIKRRDGLDLLIVDYLQLMTADDPRIPREQQVSGMSRGLKKLAKDLDIPILVLAQLNRDVEKRSTKVPQLSDLRESGAIEQDADIVMFLHRKKDSDENAMPYDVDLIVAKNRGGRKDVVNLRWREDYVEFAPAGAVSSVDF